MKQRYRPRIGLRVPVRFVWEAEVGQGQTLDVTAPGCLIESPAVVRQGQSLQLGMFIPGHIFPLSVSLGAVRWAKGKRFGVEFIKMHESQQRILQRFVAQHCSEDAIQKSSMSN